ncbi:tRNA-splicing endonuclease subunit tsp-like protein [Hapsidospora chrysogenum ATCC 11550]|uniref:tRNA-splicing endonuclease subunit Sen2 n=1 Tax=Hapsidospora chrysogenum (strain ATCC 11550 / CBS 779.69 / DSM 880 / IAM 14645 / JCM 23072 / IMI 49137) TaxID=857340 RepID=A0A086TB08_HAPC1|nr:tRNA-splicing endonuclease subunit tsp-like protein [Hapsidospora chrysogenum ATCC 11550]
MAETQTSAASPAMASSSGLNGQKPRNRQRGPPLHQIYTLPAPIRTFPLPTFYPNNPLSLFHVAYAWLSQIISPPPAQPAVVHEGTWSEETASVHVTNEASVTALWQQGFYGKGSLSRSEPNWLKREQVRRGLEEAHVSEIQTVQRREERLRAKWERARLEQEYIRKMREAEAQLAEQDRSGSQSPLVASPVGPMEILALPNSAADLSASSQANASIVDTLTSSVPQVPGQVIPGLHKLKEHKSVRFSPEITSTTFKVSDPPSPSQSPVNGEEVDKGTANGDVDKVFSNGSARSVAIVNKEHLQLMPEEALWLTFGLGALVVNDPASGRRLSTQELLTLFRQHYYFPPRTGPDDPELQPDDDFLVHYAVYHHFRSLGWVPRGGIKFGVDWLLYTRGPVFDHAQFGLVVIPSYSDPWWRESGKKGPQKSWYWLHSVIRVLSQVFKSLVFVYVDVPPPPLFDQSLQRGFAEALKLYKVREVMVKRWSSNRNR